MDHEKDREAELESAMYTNCLLLGLDPSIISVGGSLGNSRVGYFRHSNPRLGEQLLYFLLSSLRGPVQSAKDFDRVWPIFDSAQSRDFRKIVQGIISELETKGSLPRSNARISSLATCCGPRFVELLWQLSAHALREVHLRTFPSDVSSSPLPALLTDVSYLNAASLLPVTKARIALERREFLKNTNISDLRQATWSNLANEMITEFRELCAEEAHLQQELEKMQETRNKANLDGELWDDRISSSSVQNSLLVSKATRLWDSLLSLESQHEVLASGPIEDLIAHREHRYRISGTSLSAAMELSYIPHSDLFSTCTRKSLSSIDICEKRSSLRLQGKNDILSKTDDRIGRVDDTVDVAEVLRRWTHALQLINKQSLNMAKANDGEGPKLLNSMPENCSDGHAESLVAALAEHQQHLVSLQGLVNQLKGTVPVMQKSIEKLTEEVNSLSPVSQNSQNEIHEQSISLVAAQSIEETCESRSDTTTEMMASTLSPLSEKDSKNRAFKLPDLFNVTPNWSRRPVKQHNAGSLHEKLEIMPAENSDIDAYARNLQHAVRNAALSGPSNDYQTVAGDKSSNTDIVHFFVPLLNDAPQEVVVEATGGRRDRHHLSPCGLKKSPERVLSPSFLDDEPFFGDCDEDLLAPLSETDAALMGTSTCLQHNLSSGL